MGDAPIAESEVTYLARGTRTYPSRLIDRAPRPTRTVTVIAGPHEGHACILYTAFGGPLSPKEPLDPTLKPEAEEVEPSKVFWTQHALSR